MATGHGRLHEPGAEERLILKLNSGLVAAGPRLEGLGLRPLQTRKRVRRPPDGQLVNLKTVKRVAGGSAETWSEPGRSDEQRAGVNGGE